MTDDTSPAARQTFPIPVDLARTTRAAAWVFGAVMTAAIIWGIFAELHGGAIAMGEVTPFGRSKTIQHLEGGIIREIHVRDGDLVKEGQTLIALDDSEARAAFAIAETEQAAWAALVERLIAERDGRTYRPGKGSASQAVQSQLRLFQVRSGALRKEIASLESRIGEQRQELAAWQKRAEALTSLIGNADEEKRINQGLYEKNYISRTRLLALDSRSSETRASQGESEAEMARTRQHISDTEMQIVKLGNDWLNAVLDDLRRGQDELAAANEKLRVARERMTRTRVVAPQDGIVNGLRTMTLGAVVPPGGTLLDIVPVADRMVIEARVSPDDIDIVQIGSRCRVRFTAYKANANLRLEGIVREVSATTFHDEKSGAAYYTARIEAQDGQLHSEVKLQLRPGMLVEVEIIGGARSPLQYLFEPISQSLGRAFKEE